MIVLRKDFWRLVLKLTTVLAIELLFCICGLGIFIVIYMATEAESLNSYTASIFYKIILSIPVSLYNLKHLVSAYKKREFYTVIGYIGITGLYCLFVWTLGGGGR
jgi:hypothetical protein